MDCDLPPAFHLFPVSLQCLQKLLRPAVKTAVARHQHSRLCFPALLDCPADDVRLPGTKNPPAVRRSLRKPAGVQHSSGARHQAGPGKQLFYALSHAVCRAHADSQDADVLPEAGNGVPTAILHSRRCVAGKEGLAVIRPAIRAGILAAVLEQHLHFLH